MDFTTFALAALQLMVFMMFVTAVIEVIKGISALGVWGIIKELGGTLIGKTALTEDTIRTLNFIIALVFLRAFEYGAMARLLGIDTMRFGAFAYWLDYVATASVIYMGADYLFSWYWKIKARAGEVDQDHTPAAVRTETKTMQTETKTTSKTSS